VDVPISIISVTDGVMGMGFGGVLLDQEDAVMGCCRASGPS